MTSVFDHFGATGQASFDTVFVRRGFPQGRDALFDALSHFGQGLEIVSRRGKEEAEDEVAVALG